MKKYIVTVLLSFMLNVSAFAIEPFVVRDIRLEGLQRISIGTVFNYLPVKVGDELDTTLSAQAIRALYKTGFFKDVHLEREGDVLVVFVAERPAIAEINITGNNDIPSEQLEEALRNIGLVEGRVLDRVVLDSIEMELQRQYYSLGKYGVRITTETTPLERNRIAVSIQIAEGEAAEIYAMNIIGNKTFSDEQLLDKLELGGTSLFGGRDAYSKQLFSADLETIKSHYLDAGYINFNIDSTQVSLTPDKQDVYITINLTEGDKYIVRDVRLAGDYILKNEEIMGLVSIKRGEIFSRKKITDSTKNISDRLAEEGYAFANVNMVPEIDKSSKTVGLTFFIDPGRRIYVRRVNISGNAKTRDEVIRREMRQMESDWMSTKHIARSRTRLDRLGFFDEVSVETPVVPEANDQVDVNYSVVERPTGTLSAGIGYSDTQGALVNFSVTQANFVGTGKRIAVNIDNSQVTKRYSVSYTNPYYTIDGVSRSFSIFSREVDAAEADITSYVTNSYGASMNYGIPLSEHDNIRLGFGYEDIDLIVNSAETAQEILDFVTKYGNQYDTVKLTGAWTRDTRNRAIFADKGALTSLSTEISTPAGDLEFYKVGLRHIHYISLNWGMTLSLRGNLGYGDGYGDTEDLPPFENYFAGGSRSVRGYGGSSLGPKDSKGNPLGGRARIVGNMELILPNPLAENSKSTRLSVFVDGGYVYGPNDKIDLGELRYSAGLSMIWLTPVGAMRFSLARPLNDKPGDELQSFQFTLGTPF